MIINFIYEFYCGHYFGQCFTLMTITTLKKVRNLKKIIANQEIKLICIHTGFNS